MGCLGGHVIKEGSTIKRNCMAFLGRLGRISRTFTWQGLDVLVLCGLSLEGKMDSHVKDLGVLEFL